MNAQNQIDPNFWKMWKQEEILEKTVSISSRGHWEYLMGQMLERAAGCMAEGFGPLEEHPCTAGVSFLG